MYVSLAALYCGHYENEVVIIRHYPSRYGIFIHFCTGDRHCGIELVWLVTLVFEIAPFIVEVMLC